MALKYIDGKKIIHDDAEQHPGTSDYGSDFKTRYCVFTPGTQNGDEGGNFDTPYPGCYIARSQKYARKGGWSYEAYVALNDRSKQNLKYSRAELGWLSPSQQNESNEWNWAAISTLVDPSTALPNNIRYQIAYDHKESPDNRQTPFWLGIKNGNYIIDGLQVGEQNLGPVIKGQWEDWILHRDWQQNGFINFYRNGKLVWSKKGDTRVNSYIARIQHGIYKWANTNDNEGTYNANDKLPVKIYMDEIRFGMKGGTATLADFLLDGSVVVPPVDPPPVDPPPVTTGSLPVFAPVTPDTTTDKTTVDLKVFAKHTTANGHIKTFSIAQVSGPNTAKVTQSGQSGWIPTETNFKFENLIDGTYEFKVTTTDEIGGQATDNFKIVKKPVVVVPPIDTTNYYVSSVESTETITVNGVKKTVKSVVLTFKDGSKTEIYKK